MGGPKTKPFPGGPGACLNKKNSGMWRVFRATGHWPLATILLLIRAPKMKAERKLRIASLFPVYSTGQAISHIALSLCHHMRSEEMEVRLVQPASDPAGRREVTSDAIPPILKC